MSAISAIKTPIAYATKNDDQNDPLAAMADALGLSVEELKAQLADGKSPNDIATAQGVSPDDLITAIKSSPPAKTDDAGERMADPMVEPPPGGPRGANAGLRDDTKLDQISQLLNMDSDDVTDQAATASALVGMFQANGVALTSLRDVLNSGDLLDVAA
jgi:hypothetical protein